MTDLQTDFSGFLIAGTHSGSGKTTAALALMRAFARRGLRVAPFKCGPDYIDPSHHAAAAGQVSVNLDCRMMGDNAVFWNWKQFAHGAQVAVVEGVMGLFDGVASGTLEGSSAEVAALLDLPVILVVDAGGMAGSIAPLVAGFANWNPKVRIAGVIANRTGSEKHARLLADALETAGLPPLIGSFPRREEWRIPERYLGLVPGEEAPVLDVWLDQLAECVEQRMDLGALLQRTRLPNPEPPLRSPQKKRVRLAIARDRAFHFYYPDQLLRMENAGIELVDFSPLEDRKLPEEIQGIWIGGGFPELYAEELERNRSMREEIREFSLRNGWIYAECGGFMYLMEAVTDREGKRYEMCGIVPGDAVMTGRLRALGYRRVIAEGPNCFGDAGSVFRGHEFHYSEAPESSSPLWRSFNSAGLPAPSGNGFRIRRTFGSYVHLHLGSTPEAVVRFAEELADGTRS